jgi:hypothetical protein
MNPNWWSGPYNLRTPPLDKMYPAPAARTHTEELLS